VADDDGVIGGGVIGGPPPGSVATPGARPAAATGAPGGAAVPGTGARIPEALQTPPRPGTSETPPPGLPNGAEAPPPPSRSERRVYLGGGQWQSADGRSIPAPAGPHPAAGRPVAKPVPGSRVAAHPPLTRLWPLRVVLTLPLVWGAAVAAGLGVYLLVLAFTVGDPGLSDLWLALGGLAALAASLLATLSCGILLRERPRSVGVLIVIGAAAVGAVAAAILAAFGFAAVPSIAVGVLLGYAAVALALLWAAAASPPAAGSSRGAGDGSRPGMGSGFAGAPSGSSVWIDSPARWSWTSERAAGARSPAWLAIGIVGALIAAAAALAVGFAAFSLFAESFVSGQSELGWETTLWSAALDDGVLNVVTLVLANLGLAALYGLLAWGAALSVGDWRGRIAWRWAVVLGVLVVAGIVAWLLDGSLPRL